MHYFYMVQFVNLHNNTLFRDMSVERSLTYKITAAQISLHVDINFPWHTTHYKPNQNKIEPQKHTPPK
jgi:hypothetical protein